MSNAANSVTVVTTDGAVGRSGVTVSAMCSVSVDGPSPTVLVCVHQDSPTCDAIVKNGVFCANLLSDEQSRISDCFAGRMEARGETKFDCADWKTGATGAPILVGALACFDCKVSKQLEVGSHRIFIGTVEEVASSNTGKPLVYHARTYSAPEALFA